jgi:hypothetical protein
LSEKAIRDQPNMAQTHANLPPNSLNSILAVYLLRIDTSHRQAAVSQQALYMEQVHTVTD